MLLYAYLLTTALILVAVTVTMTLTTVRYNRFAMQPQLHCYYINLDSRPDRRQLIESELDRMLPALPRTRVPGVKASFGALGCAKAHLNALRLFERETGIDTACIFEDDFMFAEDPKPSLQKLAQLQIHYDVILWAANVPVYESTTFPFLVRCTDAQTTSAYMVHRSYLPALITNFQACVTKLEELGRPEHDFCLDIYWKLLQKRSRWYLFKPFVGFQREDFSDIEQKQVQYTDREPLKETRPPIRHIVISDTLQGGVFEGDTSFFTIQTSNQPGIDESKHMIFKRSDNSVNDVAKKLFEVLPDCQTITYGGEVIARTI